MTPSFKLKNAALLMALSAVYPLQSQAATAGIAQFAVGDVNVRRGQAEVPLNRGQQISSGDQVITGRSGQTQIRFSDGGLVSLAPNSQFNLDRYADENKAEDGFFASLVRGGMRAITGLVGKRNRENYKISTSTATIGIRGSAFSANYNPDGSLNVAGEQDGIVVCTNAGCVELIVGETVRVTGSDQLPVRTTARSNVPPMVAREDLFVPDTTDVVPLVSIPEQPQPTTPIVVPTQINGNLTGVSAMFAFGDGTIDINPRGGLLAGESVGFFVDGQMVRHTGSLPNHELTAASHINPTPYHAGTITVSKTSTGSGTFGTVGTASDPAFVGWGYWDAGSLTYQDSGQVQNQNLGVHYLVGRPTAQTQMPVTGTARYSLVGGSAPTAYDSETQVFRVGTLVGAGLNVDFTASRVNGFVDTLFTGPNGPMAVQISGYGSIVGSTFNSTQTGDGYSYGDSGYYFGFFTGDQASRAGLVYRRQDQTLGTIDGAAVFVKDGSGQAFSTQAGVSAMVVGDEGSNFVFDSYPRGGLDPSEGIGHFVGNELYLHDDGADSNNGYGYGGTSTYLAATSAVSSSGALGNAADADFIGWGYWAQGARDGTSALRNVHYLVGRPTPQSQMPITGVATYSLAGGTAPTATHGGNTITGRLLGASLTVDFLSGSGSASISTSFVKNGATVPVSIQDTNLYIGGATFCGSNVNGFFTGSQATRAGITYRKETGTDLGVVSGAAGLVRGAITPSPNNGL